MIECRWLAFCLGKEEKRKTIWNRGSAEGRNNDFSSFVAGNSLVVFAFNSIILQDESAMNCLQAVLACACDRPRTLRSVTSTRVIRRPPTSVAVSSINVLLLKMLSQALTGVVFAQSPLLPKEKSVFEGVCMAASYSGLSWPDKRAINQHYLAYAALNCCVCFRMKRRVVSLSAVAIINSYKSGNTSH